MRARTSFLRLVVALVLTVIMGRMVWIQAVQAQDITARGEAMRLEKKDLTPMRGAIVDREGRTLAVSIPTRTVVANPLQIEDFAQAAALLAPVLEMQPQELQKLLQDNSHRGYLVLKRGLNIGTALKIEKLVVDEGLAGIVAIPESQRSYPQGFTANHLIGYIDGKGKGEYGLEARYDKELSGKPGYVQAEFTHGNTPIENTIKSLVPSEPGLTLVLTIDADLHQQVEARLDEVVKMYKAERALAIAMDIHTGEILTMAMRPGGHPGDRTTWEMEGKTEIDYQKVVNWGVKPIPVGSIFKLITTAAALEEQTITPNTTFVDEGIMRIDGWPIRNWNNVIPVNPQPESISELLQNSSNVGLIKIGQTMERTTFKKYLEGFGFMSTTGIDFFHEDSGYFGEVTPEKPLESRAAIDWANMYIGQYLEVTPLQMLTAVAAIANGGYIVRPYLVQEIRDPDGKVVHVTKPEKRRQVISDATSREMRQLMIDIVEKGTGSGGKPQGYSVGGKTGTAQKPDPKGGFKQDLYVADFVGFAPAKDPRVAMIVIVDEPKVGQGFGGLVAAPEFAYLLPKVMQKLNIPPDKVDGKAEPKPEPKVVNALVPDVQWLPPVWAQERLVLSGFTPKLVGNGAVVVGQSVKPGTAHKAGSVIELQLAPKDPRNEHVRVPDFIGYSLTEASHLAAEIGVTLKPGGSGFVVSQEPKPGSTVPVRSTLSVHLAPKQR